MARWVSPELISAALTGDEAAAERVLAAVWPGCFRLAATIIGDWNLAQDAAQEVCVIFIEKYETCAVSALLMLGSTELSCASQTGFADGMK